MISDEPVIETSSTLTASGTFTSKTIGVRYSADYLTGMNYSDVDGTLTVQFDDGSGSWDAEETRSYDGWRKAGI